MNKQIITWKVQPSFFVDLGSKLPEQIDLPDAYVAASTFENAISLVTSLINSEVCQPFVRAVYSLSDDPYLGDNIKEIKEQDHNILVLLNEDPAKLYRIILKEEGTDCEIVGYAISDSEYHAGQVVSQSISEGAIVEGCELLSRKVFLDKNSPLVEIDKKAEVPESQNALIMLLSKEQQADPILQDLTPWFRIISNHGGKTWGQRYVNALSNLGVKTVGELALTIMALKLEALKPQRFGVPFRFANKMPNGDSLTIKTAFGGYAWKGVLDTLYDLGFQWQNHVVNIDQLKFYEENEKDKSLRLKGIWS